MKTQLKYFFITLISLVLGSSLFAQHFETIYTGFPLEPMAILMFISPTINVANLEVGDEMAVFDVNDSGDEICVGALVISSSSPPYEITAGADDGETPEQDGFIDGNTIIYRFWDSSEQMEVTVITPNYNPLEDVVFTEKGSAQLFSLAGSVTIWDGSTDTDWNTGTNWSTTTVPGITEDLLIPADLTTNYPTLSAAGSCKNITLQANATSIASILGNGNLTVDKVATVQTYITTDKWHTVSSPVAGQLAGVYYLDGDPGVWITKFTESLNNYSYITDLTDPLDDMTGYMVWVDTPPTDVTYAYTGVMNSGSFGSADNLTRTIPVDLDTCGWNLVGNPYPSAIDWDAASGWTKTDINNTIYIYSNGNWTTYNGTIGTNGGTRYIAPGQGFFVRVTQGNATGTLTMTDDVRDHNNAPLLKSSEATNFVKLISHGNDKTDESIIWFTDEATDEFDPMFDASKLFSLNDECPQIYTNTDVKYAINSRSTIEEIPLHFLCGTDGEYSISISEIDQIGEVWLEDLVSGEFTNLVNDTYTFNYLTDDDPARFVVHFSPVSLQEQQLDKIHVYAYHDRLIIKSPEIIEGEYSVFNLMGQQLARGQINGYSKQLHIDQKGYYLVQIKSQGSLVTKKVFVN